MQETEFLVTIGPGDDVLASAALAYRVDGGDLVDTPLSPVGEDEFLATLPAIGCAATIEFHLIAMTQGGQQATFPVYGDLSPLTAVSTTGLAVVYEDDLEEDLGWVVGADDDDATEGIWVLDDPIGTSSQPENDHTTDGTDCFFTGQGEKGGGQTAADVDGGKTTLMTPRLDLSGAGEATLSLWYWYSNLSGAGAQEDVFLIDASSDDGKTWVPAAQVGPTETVKAWRQLHIELHEIIELTSSVRVRFVASDEGEDTVIEAAVDDLRIDALLCEPSCPADFNDDGELNILDFVAFQLAFVAMDPAADCNLDGSLDVLDFVCFQGLFTAGCR